MSFSIKDGKILILNDKIAFDVCCGSCPALQCAWDEGRYDPLQSAYTLTIEGVVGQYTSESCSTLAAGGSECTFSDDTTDSCDDNGGIQTGTGPAIEMTVSATAALCEYEDDGTPIGVCDQSGGDCGGSGDMFTVTSATLELKMNDGVLKWELLLEVSGIGFFDYLYAYRPMNAATGGPEGGHFAEIETWVNAGPTRTGYVSGTAIDATNPAKVGDSMTNVVSGAATCFTFTALYVS